MLPYLMPVSVCKKKNWDSPTLRVPASDTLPLNWDIHSGPPLWFCCVTYMGQNVAQKLEATY